jgi:hypothetical protein
MSLAHWRASRRLGLLASDALEGEELAAARAHASECARCASELARMRLVLEQVALDPARTAEPEIDTALLVRRTLLRLDRASAPEAARPRPLRLLAPLAAAAAIAIAVLAIRREAKAPEPASVASAQRVTMPDESLRRLERTVEREQAAHYLDEAEAVLVTVAAAPQHCDKSKTTVDLTAERKRSRELLQRRALVVDMDSEEMRAVRPVLEDVERVLRQVATLDACAKPEDLIAIHEELRDRRLLMKIDLMTRELLG